MVLLTDELDYYLNFQGTSETLYFRIKIKMSIYLRLK